MGEALISFLDANGTPEMTERAFVLPPASQIGPITAEERQGFIAGSIVAGMYEKAIDRESAFEMLRDRAGGGQPLPADARQAAASMPPAPVQVPSGQSVWSQGADRSGRGGPRRGGPRCGGAKAFGTRAPQDGPLRRKPSGASSRRARRQDKPRAGCWDGLSGILFGTTGPRGGHHPGMVDGFAQSAARSVGSTVARELVRGMLGSLLGGRR